MENVKNLLPIGSVIILKNGKKKVMVIGVKQTNLANNKVYDYLAVPYPEGFISPNCMFFINEEAIETVFFRGYENEEKEEFIKRLEAYYENKEKYESREKYMNN